MELERILLIGCLGVMSGTCLTFMDRIDEHYLIGGKYKTVFAYFFALLTSIFFIASIYFFSFLYPYIFTLCVFWIIKNKLEFPSHVCFLFVLSLYLGYRFDLFIQYFVVLVLFCVVMLSFDFIKKKVSHDSKIYSLVYKTYISKFISDIILMIIIQKPLLFVFGLFFGYSCFIIKKYFQKDLVRISEFVVARFPNIVDEKFIKDFHKSLYPDGYVQKSKDSKGNEVVWMIPGTYKTMKIVSNESLGKEDYTPVSDVPDAMKHLLTNFQKCVEIETHLEKKRHLIIKFALDLVKIHPFGDGNGRIAGLMADLMCLKYNIPMLGLLKIYKTHKKEFIEVSNRAFQENDVNAIENFLNRIK